MGETRGGERLEPVAAEVAGALGDLRARAAVRRLWEADHTLWRDDPTEIVDRLGWLHLPERMSGALGELGAWGAETARDVDRVVVLGMGGSSLFAEVLARTLGPAPGHPTLAVLDTTDPAAVRRVGEQSLERALFLVSSKSGTTTETRSHLEYFWELVRRGEQFVAITDPGTPLADLARERGFRRVFEAPSDVGGRYSALSPFGLVPAALLGIDLQRLVDAAAEMAAACGPGVAVEENPGARLGAIVAGAAAAGRDKLTVLADERFAAFGGWLEQLVAESTGKDGRGILPVVGEQVGPPEVYGHDRVFVGLGADEALLGSLASAGHPVVGWPWKEPFELGAQVFLWEVATAIAGAAIGIHPFDQPDVSAAKEATARFLGEGPADLGGGDLGTLLEGAGPGDYLAIQAYVDPGAPVVGDLEQARVGLRDELRVAVTLGPGPRYLHSTGQLHKGGLPSGVFVQVLGDDPHDLGIPGAGYTFGTLKRAQADGDLAALRERGRPAARVRLEDLLAASRQRP